VSTHVCSLGTTTNIQALHQYDNASKKLSSYCPEDFLRITNAIVAMVERHNYIYKPTDLSPYFYENTKTYKQTFLDDLGYIMDTLTWDETLVEPLKTLKQLVKSGKWRRVNISHGIPSRTSNLPQQGGATSGPANLGGQERRRIAHSPSGTQPKKLSSESRTTPQAPLEMQPKLRIPNFRRM